MLEEYSRFVFVQEQICFNSETYLFYSSTRPVCFGLALLGERLVFMENMMCYNPWMRPPNKSEPNHIELYLDLGKPNCPNLASLQFDSQPILWLNLLSASRQWLWLIQKFSVHTWCNTIHIFYFMMYLFYLYAALLPTRDTKRLTTLKFTQLKTCLLYTSPSPRD